MKNLKISWDVDRKQMIVKDRGEASMTIVLFDDREKLIDIIRDDAIFTKDQKWHTFNWLSSRCYGYHEKFRLTTYRLNYN